MNARQLREQLEQRRIKELDNLIGHTIHNVTTDDSEQNVYLNVGNGWWALLSTYCDQDDGISLILDTYPYWSLDTHFPHLMAIGVTTEAEVVDYDIISEESQQTLDAITRNEELYQLRTLLAKYPEEAR